MSKIESLASLAIVLSLFATLGCGSSPSAPTENALQQGTRLTGRFASGSGQGFALSAYPQSTFDGMTVHVEEDPTIQTSVGPNGSFTLRGLPEGEFHLVFTQGGNVSVHHFDSVLPNLEITIVLEIMPGGAGVRVLSQKRTGIGHGDVEIEGIVDSIDINEQKLFVNGYEVWTQPGETAFREGNRRRIFEDIREGNRVHVKGEGMNGHIMAHEVMLQNDGTDDGTDDPTNDDPSTGTCPNGGKVGQKIVLEGTVIDGANGDFMMSATGRTEGITVHFSGTPTCVGQAGKSDTCEVGLGDKVNVKGTLTDCSLIDADEVKIQKKGTQQ
jgi:hypothetical protein